MTAPNCVGIVEAARDLDRILEGLVFRRRRRANLPGGHLLALLLQRLDDVLRRQAARLHLFRIKPDAHRILARAEYVNVADAGQAGDLVLQPIVA